MTSEYRSHHYVAQWYQRRFLLPGQTDRLLYLWKVKSRDVV
jgi:hypothetical protein